MPQNSFANGLPVAQQAVALKPQQIAHIQPGQSQVTAPPVAPSPSGNSLQFGTASGTSPGTADAKAGCRRSTPPPPPASFQARQSYLQQHAGQPVNIAQMHRTVAPAAQARPAVAVVHAPAAQPRAVQPGAHVGNVQRRPATRLRRTAPLRLRSTSPVTLLPLRPLPPIETCQRTDSRPINGRTLRLRQLPSLRRFNRRLLRRQIEPRRQLIRKPRLAPNRSPKPRPSRRLRTPPHRHIQPQRRIPPSLLRPPRTRPPRTVLRRSRTNIKQIPTRHENRALISQHQHHVSHEKEVWSNPGLLLFLHSDTI